MFHNVLDKEANPASETGFQNQHLPLQCCSHTRSHLPIVRWDPDKSSVSEIRHIMGQAGMWKNLFQVIPKVTSWCLQLAQTFYQQQNSDPGAQQSVLGSDLLPVLLRPQLPGCAGRSGIEGSFLGAGLQPFDSSLLSSCRYCGERSQFVVTSTTNKIELRFHSDQSYTDTGFSAEFLSYDSSDRELKPWGWGGQSDLPEIWNSTSSVLTLPCKLGSSLFQRDSSVPCFPANFLVFLLCSAVSRHSGLSGRNVEGTPRGLMYGFVPFPLSACPGKFTCNTGRCIDRSMRCDGWLDCVDGSDERSCSKSSLGFPLAQHGKGCGAPGWSGLF